MMNKILTALNDRYNKELYHPGFLGIFINPYYFARKLLHKAILENHHHLQGKLLDLGCGLKPYQSIFNVSQYIGVEIGDSRDQSSKHVDYFYDGKTLPFENNSFDSFFSSQVFEHIFNLEDILAEIHRVLKPDAPLLITLPFAWPEHEQPYDFARYTQFGIRSILEKQGFDIVALHKTGNYPVALCQLFAAFIQEHIARYSPIVYVLLTLLLISPLNLLGHLLKNHTNQTYYLDTIIVARKNIRMQKN